MPQNIFGFGVCCLMIIEKVVISMQFTKQDTLLVKGVAILMMMLHHCFTSADRYAGYDIDFGLLGEGYTVEIASFCKICVSLFVFLSGYGITVSLKKQSNLSGAVCALQIKRRLWSLMSGFWFVFIISVILTLIIDRDMFNVYRDYYFPDSVLFFVVDFLGLSELFGTPTLIGTWWYMSLAIIIVVITPIFYVVFKKFGAVTLFVITFCLCGFYKDNNYDMVRWMFTLALGMYSAEHNLLAKLAEKKIIKKINWLDYTVKFILYTVIFMALVVLRQKADYTVSYLRDGLIPMFVVFYSYTILSKIPVLNKVLIFLGKHSMNMFLFHTFLRAYFLKDFIYSLKYSVVIVVVLTVISLISSIILEFIKEKIKYQKLMDFLYQKLVPTK